MHLQLNLSNQLVKQWKLPLSETRKETHPLLRWRVDKMKLGNTTSNYVCVNEETLFSFVLAGVTNKRPHQVQQIIVSQLAHLLRELYFPEEAFELLRQPEILLGKTDDKKLIAITTHIRQSYNIQYEYTQVPLSVAEHRINTTPMCGPNYRYAMEEFLTLRNNFMDSLDRFVEFTFSTELLYFARRNLPEIYQYPLYNFTIDKLTAKLPIEELQLLLTGIRTTLSGNRIAEKNLFEANRLISMLSDAINDCS